MFVVWVFLVNPKLYGDVISIHVHRLFYIIRNDSLSTHSPPPTTTFSFNNDYIKIKIFEYCIYSLRHSKYLWFNFVFKKYSVVVVQSFFLYHNQFFFLYIVKQRIFLKWFMHVWCISNLKSQFINLWVKLCTYQR